MQTRRADAGQKKNLIGLIVSSLVVLGAPLAGMLATMLWLRSAFHATATVDPSQKARVLAEGISEAMNGAACGMVVSLIALVPAVIFAVRVVRGARRRTSEEREPPPQDHERVER